MWRRLHCLVCDFGLAAVNIEGSATGRGGTPGYWAPELVPLDGSGNPIPYWTEPCSDPPPACRANITDKADTWMWAATMLAVHPSIATHTCTCTTNWSRAETIHAVRVGDGVCVCRCVYLCVCTFAADHACGAYTGASPRVASFAGSLRCLTAALGLLRCLTASPAAGAGSPGPNADAGVCTVHGGPRAWRRA